MACKGSSPAPTAGLSPVGIATDDEVRHVARHALSQFRRGLHVSGDSNAEVGAIMHAITRQIVVGGDFAERGGEDDRGVYHEGLVGRQR